MTGLAGLTFLVDATMNVLAHGLGVDLVAVQAELIVIDDIPRRDVGHRVAQNSVRCFTKDSGLLRAAGPLAAQF